MLFEIFGQLDRFAHGDKIFLELLLKFGERLGALLEDQDQSFEILWEIIGDDIVQPFLFDNKDLLGMIWDIAIY